MDGKWMVNDQEDDIWSGIDGGDEFDTKDEAIAYARQYQNDEESEYYGQTLYVGMQKLIDPKDYFYVDANDLCERAAERLWDRMGEAADDWPGISKDQATELRRRLDECTQAFIADYKSVFGDRYMIEKVEEVKPLND